MCLVPNYVWNWIVEGIERWVYNYYIYTWDEGHLHSQLGVTSATNTKWSGTFHSPMLYIVLIMKQAELPFHINLCGSNFRFYGQPISNLYWILTFLIRQFLTCSLCLTTVSIPHLRLTSLATLHALMFQMIYSRPYIPFLPFQYF